MKTKNFLQFSKIHALLPLETKKKKTKHVRETVITYLIIFQPVFGPQSVRLKETTPCPFSPPPSSLLLAAEFFERGRVGEWKSSIPYANSPALWRRLARVEDPRCRQFEKPPPENVSIGRHNSIWIMNERPLCKFRPLSKGPRYNGPRERRYFTRRATFRSSRITTFVFNDCTSVTPLSSLFELCMEMLYFLFLLLLLFTLCVSIRCKLVLEEDLCAKVQCTVRKEIFFVIRSIIRILIFPERCKM